MASNRALAKTIVLVIGVVLGLAALQLWWQRGEEQRRQDKEHIRVIPQNIHGDDSFYRMGDNHAATPQQLKHVRDRQVRVLRDPSRDLSERRAAASRMQWLVDYEAESDLLIILSDKDQDHKVAQRCAEALTILWQQSDSQSVSRVLKWGLEAHQDGNFDEALENFDMCAQLDPNIPDLYRLRAGISLKKGQTDKALADCRAALKLKDQNFMALYVQAQCYLEKRDGKAALDSVNKALEIYAGFQQAQDLKTVIKSMQKAGEL